MIDAFHAAVELDGDNAWAWNNLGLVYLTLADHEAAATALREATRRPAVTGYMWNNLGLAYEQLERLDDARDAFERGAALGSHAARASRARLEGVEIVHTYDVAEPMPEVVPDEVIPDEEPPETTSL